MCPPHAPYLSVITVCRNSAASIARTVESVLDQKEPDVEYLVVDGASTDGTQAIVSSYPAVDRLLSEPDSGIADAFNKGISLASGEIVALINSDDRLCPSALASVRRHFAEHPEVEVVHGDVLLLEGERVVKTIKPPRHWWYPWRLVLFNHPATFVRRGVYQRLGLFDTSYAIAMDVEIFLRWRSNGVSISYLPLPLVAMQGGGVSGVRGADGFREVRSALCRTGHSPLLAYLQFCGKFLLWKLLALLARGRGSSVLGRMPGKP